MELFKLFGTIAINNSEAIQKTDETVEHAEESGSRLGSILGGIGTSVGAMAVAIGTGVTAAATGIARLTTSAVQSYAEFEQLTGGIETLFGDASETVMTYAENAFMSAGLSANSYMETVTSFSASLIQSLDGDTQAAAEMSNMAITDMSDNANRMGSDINSIINAYQGFSRGQFQLLDNLKIGYGGTQEEMERLLRDATAISGVEYNIDSYSDIVEAIHVVQTELGITGTTQLEATQTISGSISMLKASWENMLAGLGDENADMEVLIDNLVNSAVTAADNVIPRIEAVLGGIADVIPRLVPIISERLPSMFESILPPLLEGAVALVNGLISAIPTLLEILLPEIPFIIEQIGLALIEVFPQLLQVCESLFSQLWDYFSLNLLNTGVGFEDMFVYIEGAFQVAWEVLQTIWTTVGEPIFTAIYDTAIWLAGIFEAKMPEILAFVESAIGGIVDTWNNHLKPAFEAIGQFLETILLPLFQSVFEAAIVPLIDNAFSTIVNLWNGTLKPVFDGVCDFLTGVFTGNWEQAFQGILDIVTGIFDGIVTSINSNMTTAEEVVGGAIQAIIDFFDFEWSLPDLSLPHFTISGRFSLDPPSVPSFDVEWYAKAMDEPFLFTQPTVVGMKGFGDAGDEIVYGRENLMNDIKNASGQGSIELQERLNKIIEILERILGMKIVLDSGALVGELAPAMDSELGNLYEAKERGGRSTW